MFHTGFFSKSAIGRLLALPFTAAILVNCQAQGTLDNTFAIGTGANARVACSVMQNDGKVIAGGDFTSYNGTSINRVMRLRRDGSLDPGFTPGTGANGQVNALALASGGDVYIGGAFTSYNGTGRNRIARLNSDGSLDTGFNPGTGFNNTVTGVVVQNDGKVVCVGNFTSYNGTGRNRIARLNSDGSLDTGFNPGTGANFLVTSVALQGDGKLLIGGYFNNYNGTTVVAIARINSDGSLDTGYNSGGSGMNNAVSSITLQSDGKALVGGLFTTYNGTGRVRILRLNTDGSLDTSFDPGLGAAGAGADVLAIAVQSNGQVLIGGTFTTVNGSTRNRIARLNADGSLDGAWTAGANNALNTILWIPEGRVIIGGVFTSYDSNSRNRIVRLNAQCTDNVALQVRTDGAGAEVGWEIVPYGYTYAAYSGSGLPNNSIVLANACLADGCYQLRVTDSGGNGITDGGYRLYSQSTDRIIDNWGNFTTGSLSQISGTQGGPDRFCIPFGTHKPIYTSRDKEDWKTGQFLVAEPDAAVSQVWTDYGSGSPQRANTGYDFWFFDPNGGYTFIRSRRHSTSDGFAPASATRACHMKINNWSVPNHLQDSRLYNVRIRPVLLGVAGDWGPAFRFRIDALRAQCPLTKLMDIPGNPYLSCGQTRSFGPGNYVHARPVSGANKYEFRFRIIAEAFSVTRQSNTYFVELNWVVDPLQVGKTYDVDVRVSFDGGATWCTDFIPPSVDPWGEVCTVTIVAAMPPGQQNMALNEDAVEAGTRNMHLWPNPSQGGHVEVRVDGLAENAPLYFSVLDALGREVAQHVVAAEAPLWQGAVVFPDLAPGLYTLRATQGAHVWTQRWVVER